MDNVIKSIGVVLKGMRRNISEMKKVSDDAAEKANKATESKMDKLNPVCEGYFRMGSEVSEERGRGSFAAGENTIASGEWSHAEGYFPTAKGWAAHAEGRDTKALGDYSHAENYKTTAEGDNSHAEGSNTNAKGAHSHAEGSFTQAVGKSQHVQGEYNIIDYAPNPYNRGRYAHIVGNGTEPAKRSNAHTLDWDGNAWFAGTMEGTAVILKSSTEGSAKRFKITVDDSGTISATEVTE